MLWNAPPGPPLPPAAGELAAATAGSAAAAASSAAGRTGAGVTLASRERTLAPPAPSAGGFGGDGLVVMNVVGGCMVTESMTRLKR